MSIEATDRLAAEVFNLPVERLRDGYYADAYFVYAKQLLEAENHHPHVTLQVFQKQQSLVGGIDEAIAILKAGAGHRAADGSWIDGFGELVVHALDEGDEAAPFETVMTIEGDYSLFAHLETVYLGSLARRSLIMRNVKAVVDAARGKPILYFPARHDHWRVQTGDGWAAHVAGAIGVSTDAQASWWGGRGVGTVPHALIAAYGGDTVKAAQAFANRFRDEMNITVLIDFENDSPKTAVEVAQALGDDLWGVRLDTSEQLVDASLWVDMAPGAPGLTSGTNPPPGYDPRGVNAKLVWNVRNALDEAGFQQVKIVVSGGFTAERIGRFEREGIPVDAYGVGSSLIRGQNDYTADVVIVDGKPCAKVGRAFNPNPRLRRVV